MLICGLHDDLLLGSAQAVLLMPSVFRDRKSILTTDTHTLDIAEILDLLPHRYPFLLVDRGLEFE